MRMKTLWLFSSLALLMIAATGCWQPAGDGESPTLVGLPLPSPTMEPTNTDEPPTITPTPSPTSEVETEIEGAAQGVDEEETLESVAQEPTVDDLIIQATTAVAAETQAVIAITQTFEAGFTIPAETPTEQIILTATPTQGDVVAQPPLGADCIHEVRAGQNLYRLSLLYGVTIQEIMVATGLVNMNLIYPGQKLRIPNCGTTGAVPPPTSTPRPGQVLPPDPPAGGTGQVPGGTVGNGGYLCGIAPTDPNGGFWPACLGGYGGVGVATTTDTTGTAGTVGQTTSAGGVQHTVSAGENVFTIAQRYNVTPDSIIAANGLDSTGLIVVGQVLTIP